MLLYQIEETTQSVCMGQWIAFNAEDYRVMMAQFSYIEFMHDLMEMLLYGAGVGASEKAIEPEKGVWGYAAPGIIVDWMFGGCYSAFHRAVASQMFAWEAIIRRHVPFWPDPVPEMIIGMVTEVIDGDTFWISCGDLTKVDPSDIYSRFDPHKAGPTYKVRMAGIDAPEKDTPEGIEAKAYLTELIEGAFVRLQIDQSNPTGKYFRLIATVWRYGENINEEMVRAGHAVPFTWKE